jgi:hypothetical protein
MMKNSCFISCFVLISCLFGCGGGQSNSEVNANETTSTGVALPVTCGQNKVLNHVGNCVAYTILGNQVWYLNSTGQKVYFDQGNALKEYTLDAQGNKTYLN